MIEIDSSMEGLETIGTQMKLSSNNCSYKNILIYIISKTLSTCFDIDIIHILLGQKYFIINIVYITNLSN